MLRIPNQAFANSLFDWILSHQRGDWRWANVEFAQNNIKWKLCKAKLINRFFGLRYVQFVKCDV